MNPILEAYDRIAHSGEQQKDTLARFGINIPDLADALPKLVSAAVLEAEINQDPPQYMFVKCIEMGLVIGIEMCLFRAGLTS